MCFKYFSKMREENALTLVDPFLCWEDTYEGAFYRAMQDEKTFNYLVQTTHHSADTVQNILAIKKLFEGPNNIKAQSWTKAGDDLLMWSAYSYGKKSIMVVTNTGVMKKICENTYMGSHELVMPSVIPISYCFENETDIQQYIRSTFDSIKSPSIRIFEPLTYKRKELEYEKEVRLFAIDMRNTLTKTGHLKIPSISAFIEGVMVHPGASKCFAGRVRNLCALYGITFMGQSKKYDTSFLNNQNWEE